jgi:tRNA pseudouridine55 synthase
MPTALKKNVHGVFLLDKPLGMSSNHALQRVKRLFQAKKAGHTGSLDPLATGLLPICLGEATKYTRFLLDAAKNYQVIAKLGSKTTTLDAEGDIILERPVPTTLSSRRLASVLAKFQGDIQQIPPMHSALKQQGQPLYKLARQGVNVARLPRLVTVYELTVVQQTVDEITLNVHCSKGTYIRTLVDDIGELLGCGAHVQQLRRLGVGGFTASQMVTLTELATLAETDELTARLLPVEATVTSLPRMKLTAEEASSLYKGQCVHCTRFDRRGWMSLWVNDQFIGVGEVEAQGGLIPRRLVASR